MITVRRPHPPQSQQLRRQRFREEVRWILSVLGCYLVDYLSVFHGYRNHRWNRGVP